MKERNRLATEDHERKRLKAGYGDFESQNREKEVSSCYFRNFIHSH